MIHYGMKELNGKSFNDRMIRAMGIPIVFGWLLSALAIIGMGIYSPERVMPMLDGFISLLAIVGTLATLIVTSTLELWKSEQQKQIEVIPQRLEHEARMDMAEREHAMAMEAHERTGNHENGGKAKSATESAQKKKTE